MDSFEQATKKQKAAAKKAREAKAAKAAKAANKPRKSPSPSPERKVEKAKKSASPKPKAGKKGGAKKAKKAGSPKSGVVEKRSVIARAAEKDHKIVIVAADGKLKRVGRSGAESALAAVKAASVTTAAIRSASKEMGMVLRKKKDKTRERSAYHEHMSRYLRKHRAQAKKDGVCMSDLLTEAVAAWNSKHGKKTVGKKAAGKKPSQKKSKKFNSNSRSISPRNKVIT